MSRLNGPLYAVKGEGEGAGAGTGDGKSGAFDPAAFQKTVLDEVNKTLNGALKNLKTDITKLFKSSAKDEGGGEGTGEGTGEGGGAGTGTGTGAGVAGEGEGSGAGKGKDAVENTELARLRKLITTQGAEIKKLSTEREQERTQRLETERVTAIKDAANAIPFKDDKARQVFLKSVMGDIKRDDDGKFIAETDAGPMLMAEYLQEQASLVPDLLQAKGNGGSGARGGRAGTGGEKTGYEIEDITPEKLAAMKPSEKAALLGQINTAYRDALAGKT